MFFLETFPTDQLLPPFVGLTYEIGRIKPLIRNDLQHILDSNMYM